MNKQFCWLVAAMLAAGLQTTAARQTSGQGEKLLAGAQHKATVDGDLKGAIEDYRTIVAGAGANRALAANALVQMGECYQKLGDVESSRIYERVLREYADQPEAVSVARARLARARPAASGSGIVARQVWTGPRVDAMGTVSPDGRLVSFVDWSTGNLALHDLTTGTDRPLTSRLTALDTPFEMAMESAISPDGKQVAYAWDGAAGRSDLRLVSTEGTSPATPRVIYTAADVESIAPHAWSPDGRWIAVQLRKKDHTAHIGLVNAGDGSLRTLKSADWRLSTRLFFSPDGKYLALDLPSGDKTQDRDVFVLPVDGSLEIPAVVNPGNDVAIGWTPDGRRLLFASDRSGSKGLWVLSWENGKPQGEPALIKTDIDLEAPLGLTRAGALYYGLTLSHSDVYVAAMDTNSGEVLSPPVRPTRQSVGTNHSPDWSPDGKELAYVSSRKVLAIRSMETGEFRELRPALSGVYLPRWSPDGRSFAVLGLDEKGAKGIYRVDARDGAVSSIVQVPIGDALWGLAWLPDGKRLVFREGPPALPVVVEYNSVTGTRRELVRGSAASLSLSPDGRQLAYVARSGSSWQLMVVPVAGGQPREVPLQGVQAPIMVIAWTPDNRAILFRTITGNDHSSDTYLVSPEGGPLRKVGLNIRTTVAPLRFNPRSNQIALTADTSRREVWVLEDFLPNVKAAPVGRKH